MNTVWSFLVKFASLIVCKLDCFDRMIFKGHLMALYKQDGARCFLWSQGVPLTDFTDYAKGTTERIANNARKLVTDAGRPVISFDECRVASPGMTVCLHFCQHFGR